MLCHHGHVGKFSWKFGHLKEWDIWRSGMLSLGKLDIIAQWIWKKLGHSHWWKKVMTAGRLLLRPIFKWWETPLQICLHRILTGMDPWMVRVAPHDETTNQKTGDIGWFYVYLMTFCIFDNLFYLFLWVCFSYFSKHLGDGEMPRAAHGEAIILQEYHGDIMG